MHIPNRSRPGRQQPETNRYYAFYEPWNVSAGPSNNVTNLKFGQTGNHVKIKMRSK